MKVHYQWTEEGVAELCELEVLVAQEATTCYHCGREIQVNEIVLRLTAPDGDVYVMHLACADRGCSS